MLLMLLGWHYTAKNNTIGQCKDLALGYQSETSKNGKEKLVDDCYFFVVTHYYLDLELGSRRTSN